MKLKTVPKIVLEKCEIDKEENSDLLLLGVAAARKDLIKFEGHTDDIDNQLDESITFRNEFNLGTKLYYQLMIFKNNKSQHIEIGVGTVIAKNNRSYLKRLMTFTAIDHEGRAIETGGGFVTEFVEEEFTHMHLTNYIAKNALQLVADPDTVLATTLQDGPTPIYMENDTCLAKVNDKIQALPISEIFSLKSCAEGIVNGLMNYSKKISVKASSFFCKLLECNSIILHSAQKQKEKEGTIIYDNKSKCLKFHDGSQWRTLKHDEDT